MWCKAGFPPVSGKGEKVKEEGTFKDASSAVPPSFTLSIGVPLSCSVPDVSTAHTQTRLRSADEFIMAADTHMHFHLLNQT